MQAARQEVPTTLTQPSITIRTLRCKLILEEALEFLKASGVEAYDTELQITDIDYVELSTYAEADTIAVADALADLLYVVYGAAVAYGINIDPVFGEVHRSNMTKFIDGTFREDGKYLKGPSYEKTRIKEVLDAQVNT